jgi:Fe-S oxidoreductase/FAD/FMN-containing dehydrogenase
LINGCQNSNNGIKEKGMGGLTKQNRAFLENIFRDRVSFDSIERKLYSHDIGALPNMIKPLIGGTTPDAVVQPGSEKELVELVQWARENSIPITPRGKATSGYGGAVPIEKGLVIDFYHMNRIKSIDKASLTATVQAGVVWEKLDQELYKQGLTLKLYPTSYLSSTVGGWLAQGGAGIGSFDAGWFRNNVLEARGVLPDGSVKTFSGDELDLVSDAEGITGLISEVTIKVQQFEEMDVIAVGCNTPDDLQKLTERFIEKGLPLWSIIFINPKMAELRNKAPLKEHLGHVVEQPVQLPASFIATLTFRKKDEKTIKKGLEEAISELDGEILAEEIADHEWEKRFKIMRIKRLGPSLIPVEIVVPLSRFAKIMNEITRKIAQPIVKEGIFVKEGRKGEPEVVILGFIPGDQRKFNYNLVFSLSLSVIKIAEKYGGRAYSTGLYFAGKASEVLGGKKLQNLQSFKEQIDPDGIMNPGKVLEKRAITRAIGLAGGFESFLRAFGNRAKTQIGERPKKPVRGIPEDVAWYAYSCSQCGFCIDECDQFYGRGWESQSPRGKFYWLREYMEGREEWNQKMVDSILSCTTCELCNDRCSEFLPIEPSWMKLRGQLIETEKKMTFPPFEVMATALKDQGNIWAGYRKERTAWIPDDIIERHGLGKKSKVVYFAGCTASYIEQDIGIAAVRLLDAAGVDFTHLGNDENCCGTPMLVAGKWELFAENMKNNIRLVEQTGADTVVTSCPACDMMWRHTYPQWAKKLGIDYTITTKHYSEIVSEKLKAGEFTFPEQNGKRSRVTWHDSCHIGRVSGVYEPPRELIKAIPNTEFIEMEYNRENSHCCGSVLTLIKDPPVAADVGKKRLDEAVEAGAEKVLALCPCCEFQLRVSSNKKNAPVEVVDLARYAVSALGHELPDPNPEVKRQWAVFEAMIDLMTPKGFATIMQSMWPELIDAIPMGMGKMMKLMGKVPGALNLMKPMFPVLFPKLLPRMMPKVMPVMLEKIGERIPMPDYMAEQMPDILPGVMDNVMPHMIKDVVPLVTQPMIDYLRGKAV